MIDADVQNFDLINEALHEFTRPETRLVQPIDLQDESISAAFRGAEYSLDSIQEALTSHINRQEAKEILSELRELAKNSLVPSRELVLRLTPRVLEETSIAEKKELIDILLSSEPSIEACAKVLLILEQIDYGARLDSKSRSLFFSGEMPNIAKLFSLSPTHQQANALANSFIRERLERLARGLPTGQLREYYLSSERSATELTEVLKHVSSEQRLSFVTELLLDPDSDSERANFLADKLDNIGHQLSANEKSSILGFLISNHNRLQAANLVCKVLRSCESLSELVAVIDSTGESTLLALNNRDLNEYLAQAKLSPRIRAVLFPDRPRAEIGARSLEIYREEFEAALDKIRSICESSAFYRSTRTVQDYLQTLTDNFSQLDAELTQLRNNHSVSTGALIEEMAQVIERHCAEAKIEFCYGVSLTSGSSDYLDRTDQHAISADEFGIDISQIVQKPINSSESSNWTLSDLTHIEDVLSRIPEGDVLFSDLFKTIERVPSLGWGVLGARYPGSGVIKIASLTIENQQIANQYQGLNSLKIVLAHEIGHALQIGDGASGIYFPNEADPYFGKGEEIHDFDEWISLSGWKVYDRTRVTTGTRSGTVKVDGIELPLNVPVELDGNRVILQFNPAWNLLTSYNADANFSSRWYARTSPWEDFAEAFSEYLYLPERLIQDAPQKFKHLEQEFKRYERNSELQQMLEQALKLQRSLKGRPDETSSLDNDKPQDFWVIEAGSV